MTVQRYTLHGNPKANDRGQWVRFSDHQKALQALAEKPLPPLPPPYDVVDPIDVDQTSMSST